ncbi:MAG: leucine-rich repeat protein [bacterium]|nr:leucine-rich repeat protein [bacterium]
MKIPKRFFAAFTALCTMLSSAASLAAEDGEVSEIYVDSSAELTQAIGSDSSIILADGVYELEGTLEIYDVQNLTIKAANSGKAEILSTDGGNPVVTVDNSGNISLEGMILGHDSITYDYGCGDTEYSSGYVFYSSNSQNITVSNCDLYGCGTVGAVLLGVRGFTASGCVIRDCKEYIAKIDSVYDYASSSDIASEDILFENCVISGNAYDTSYARTYPAVSASSAAVFRGCKFLNNESRTFADAANSENVITEDCIFENNVWDGKTTEDYGICLNGITWQAVRENGLTLRLGFDLELENSVIASEKGGILPYSTSSLPWKDVRFYNIEIADGIVYDLGGQLGDNLTWKLDLATGTLTVSGTGEMIDDSRPWSTYTSLIRSIVIEEGVTSVGSNSFYGCNNLTEVTLPEGLESIGESAFSSAYNLTGITFPETLKSLGRWAFSGCNAIKTVTIPKNVESIASEAFSSCMNLEAINVSSENQHYTDVGGVLFDKELTRLMQYPARLSGGSYTTPSTVESIDTFAFYGCAYLTELTVSEGVKAMGDRAVVACEKLKSISLPSTLETIDANAEGRFANCTKLKSITVAEGNTAFTDVDGVLFSADMKTLLYFPAAHSLTYVVPDGVEEIADGAFRYSAVTEVEFPDGISVIGDNAFSGCENLSVIEIPSNGSGTKIGSYAFWDCSSLRAFIAPITVIDIGYAAFSYCDKLTIYCDAGMARTYAINNGINYADTADYTDSSVTGDGWTLKNGVLTVTGDSTDNGWLEYPDDINIIRVAEGVTSLPARAFSGLQQTTALILPDSLESIGNNAFSSLYRLDSINLGKNVKNIGTNVFPANTEVTVDSDNPYFTVEGSVLYDKNKTRPVYYFSEADSYTLPATVTQIDPGVLTNVNVAAKKFEVEEGSAAFTAVDGVLFSKDKTVLVAYPASNPQTSYKMPDSVKKVSDYAFYFSRNLTALSFSSNLEEIGASAFSICGSLTEITLPRSLRTVGAIAFSSCNALKTVTFTPGVTEIGRNAFSSCTALEKIVIPATAETIGANAFRYCDNVTVYGMPGSAAQSYASENSIPFEELETVETRIVKASASSDGENIEVSVEAQGADGAAMFVAGYGGNGMEQLADIDDGTASINAEGVTLIKVFCWESLNSMKPLCDPEVISIQ